MQTVTFNAQKQNQTNALKIKAMFAVALLSFSGSLLAASSNVQKFSWVGTVPTQTDVQMKDINLEQQQYQNAQLTYDNTLLHFEIKETDNANQYIKVLNVKM